MMDNQCANIFSTHATVYGSHSVKFAFIERDNIFLHMYPQLSQFLSLGCVFFFSLPPKFFPKLVLFFLFLQGEKLVFNFCCSQGELSLFYIELNCFVFPYFSIFSYSLLCMFFVELLIGLSLLVRDKKGERDLNEMWES